MKTINVAVMGAAGKMGREICKAVINEPGLNLVAAFDVMFPCHDIGSLIGMAPNGVVIERKYNKKANRKIDVVIDFTNAQALLNNIDKFIDDGINVVIGTTGLTDTEISAIGEKAKNSNVGVFMAPNFAIGAVLMMKFAIEAAKYLPHVEIIELHHDQKLDAPSGTAIKTLNEISKVRKAFHQGADQEYEKIPGARGGDYEGMRIHSVRLPGLVAHQEVLFGGLGQTLSIRHDSISRESFMAGIMLAVKKVSNWQGLVYGLENILE
ncbi:MAG: 4-hydroxy-tetrahydrodipicolinate reductase [Clostridia bacterium]|nr:4-hydroxy-tetrahydrodipicolinate reductase [Clostridia bacterium]